MYLKNVCGLLTLQVGVVAFSSIFITQVFCTLLVNTISLDLQEPLPWIVMFLFLAALVVIWSIAFVGSYTESIYHISVANALWVVYILSWVVMMLVRIMTNKKDVDICVGTKCPTGLWLISTSCDMTGRHNETISGFDNYKSKRKQNNSNDSNNSYYARPACKNGCKIKRDRKQLSINGAPDRGKETTGDGLKYFQWWPLMSNCNGTLVLSIIVSFLYIQLLLYSWQVLFSYKKELKDARRSQLQG